MIRRMIFEENFSVDPEDLPALREADRVFPDLFCNVNIRLRLYSARADLRSRLSLMQFFRAFIEDKNRRRALFARIVSDLSKYYRLIHRSAFLPRSAATQS